MSNPSDASRTLSILYRGSLASCNYACWYCPFSKRRQTRTELAADHAALERFVSWCRDLSGWRLSVFFTPWGEALTRIWYREAMTALSHLPQICRVAAQTNLSGSVRWVAQADRQKLAFWATFHPGQVSRKCFLGRCRELHAQSVRFSVGAVGLKEHAGEIEQLRRELPPDVYLWINAYKDTSQYYTEHDVRRFEEVDPLFRFNTVSHASRGRLCNTGASVISVDGAGTIRRCHFVKEELGNIYKANWERALTQRVCPAAECGCHIGYVHLEHVGLQRIFGEGILERVPENIGTSSLFICGGLLAITLSASGHLSYREFVGSLLPQ